MTQHRFAGKTAIVTGAAHGIGAAIARRLAREGAQVMVADIDAAQARQTAAEIVDAGGVAASYTVNVSERVQVAELIAATLSRWGQLDIMVANAAIFSRAPFLDMEDSTFEKVLAVNLHGSFYCGQLAARQMVEQGKGGRIVNLASNSGIFGGRGRAAYGASKAGIINLTQTMAIELAEHNILVNAVAPGATRTRAVGDVAEPGASVRLRAPISRFGTPDEIASIAAFLASEECSFTTGHVYAADGGYTVAGVMEG